MTEQMQKYLLFFLLIAVVVLGGLFFYQQSKLNEVRQFAGLGVDFGKQLNSSNKTVPASHGQEDSTAEYKKNLPNDLNQLKEIKEVRGKITSIDSAGKIQIESEVIDLSKFKRGNDVAQAQTIKKNFTVTLNKDTKIVGNSPDKMKTGEVIRVISKEPIYQTDKLTALTVFASPAEE